MDYKSVFTNLCLELQQNRSWIKGLGKNPQKSELIHWRQCLLSGGTEACSLGLRETPACIHAIQRLSQPRVACWHGFRKNSQKMECVFTRCPTSGLKNKFGVYTASEAKELNKKKRRVYLPKSSPMMWDRPWERFAYLKQFPVHAFGRIHIHDSKGLIHSRARVISINIVGRFDYQMISLILGLIGCHGQHNPWDLNFDWIFS